VVPASLGSRSNVEASVYPTGCKSMCASTIEYKVICEYWYIALGMRGKMVREVEGYER
jgi:hypothetical protein